MVRRRAAQRPARGGRHRSRRPRPAAPQRRCPHPAVRIRRSSTTWPRTSARRRPRGAPTGCSSARATRRRRSLARRPCSPSWSPRRRSPSDPREEPAGAARCLPVGCRRRSAPSRRSHQRESPCARRPCGSGEERCRTPRSTRAGGEEASTRGAARARAPRASEHGVGRPLRAREPGPSSRASGYRNALALDRLAVLRRYGGRW
jgi:hypothetical protein